MRTTFVIKTRGTFRFTHFESEKLVKTLSMKDRALLVKMLYKNDECAAVVLKKFLTVKDMKKG